jgi:hypothetical protein
LIPVTNWLLSKLLFNPNQRKPCKSRGFLVLCQPVSIQCWIWNQDLGVQKVIQYLGRRKIDFRKSAGFIQSIFDLIQKKEAPQIAGLLHN